MNREQWLIDRRSGIGGSDAAAIAGLSTWKTPLRVYLDKRGLLVDDGEDNARMKWGRALEPVIRQEYCDRYGVEVAVPQGIMRHPEHDFIIGTPDGIVTEKSPRILEIKTAGSRDGWGPPETDIIPQSYLVQVQHYMMITGLSLADIAVLFYGSDFQVYHVEANKEIQDQLLQIESDFWHHNVLAGVEPEFTTVADVKLKFPSSKGTSIVAVDYILSSLQAITLIREHIAVNEEEEERITAKIMHFMGENDTLVDQHGEPLVTWKKAKDGESFDKNKLKKDRPDIYRLYAKPTTGSRRFLIK